MASDARGFTYDVFLSFRGKDTRYGFTGNLWRALCDRGIRTFMDDEELQKGEEISPSLANAIEQSKIAIVVLSKNYATSSFCLKELCKILDCCIKEKGRLVWPVFYDVDPSDVRKLKRTYGEAMDMHEKSSNDNMDRLLKWKKALHQVANLSGFHYKNGDGYQHKFIEKIVKEVSREIKPFTLPVADYLVGLEPQMHDVISLLKVGSEDKVHMVGIHGIGGIGKTTLALAVYNLIADQFEGGLCFLENVRANSKKHGLSYLQKIILSKTVGEFELTSVKQGIATIQQRLPQKKVLLLLDDVDKMEQLKAIAGKSDWFGLGSRVIITTRDKGLLTCHKVGSMYEMKELNNKDALELLRWKALRSDKFSPSYECASNLLKRAVTYASGLPLALEVVGSHLSKKGIEEWQDALDRYERSPHNEIQEILKISFDALDEEEKSVFLDIACCFKGYELVNLERILHAHHGNNMKEHIRVLVEKSLIKISESGDVTLHDLMEDMGKEIVRQESPGEPGRRSRLWFFEDIVQVLEENTGTSKIEIICFDSWIKVNWDGEAFKKMENLKTLIIRALNFSESPRHLPNRLRALEWQVYPSQDLPYDFHPKNLVMCKLDLSRFTSVVLGDLFKKKFENMKFLNLDGCDFLTLIPDVSSLPNLEEFSFQFCWNLSTIDDSVGLLGKLKTLRAGYCGKLTSIPPLKLPLLEQLDLSSCGTLESFPPINGSLGKLKILSVKCCRKLKSIPPLKLPSLEQLDLSSCSILESIPPMVESLDKLKILSVKGCMKLRSIPPLELPSLEQLDFSSCDSLQNFPEILEVMENITQLYLEYTPIKELPFSFQNLTRLKSLYLSSCGIVQLSGSIVMMSELAKLTIEDGGWLFPKQDEGEEKVSPMHSSQVECIKLQQCNLSYESLATGLKWFANVKELYLSESKFTILPKCIENCLFLWKLILDNCKKLQKIEGIPPGLKTLSALHCKYLTSSCKSKLLNQDLHEAGNTSFHLPGEEIPEWFDHQLRQENPEWFNQRFNLQFMEENPEWFYRLYSESSEWFNSQYKGEIPEWTEWFYHQFSEEILELYREYRETSERFNGQNLEENSEWFKHQFSLYILRLFEPLSISFWFHNKFPAIALCVVFESDKYEFLYPLRVIINGKEFFYSDSENKCKYPGMDHLHVFHMQIEKFNDNLEEALSENLWNHAKVVFKSEILKIGIHVLKEKSSLNDIRFTNPARLRY